MTDNWSLKGKGECFNMECGIFPCENTEVMEDCPYKSIYYYHEDIEILRQKLIDDIKEYIMQVHGGIEWIDKWHSQNIERLINRRFGVDEDARD